ncbi:uncharacterized protein IWZ02DRAFT_505504 [Phyllosticta citriasiana]|uniref:uncharacterized protein n=1 Tax=Phyllosticta citriasiana TaxID=595635 RepID=UPI0030FDDC86
MRPLGIMLVLAALLAFSSGFAVNLTRGLELGSDFPDDPTACFLCTVSDVEDTACGPGRYDEEECDVPAALDDIFEANLASLPLSDILDADSLVPTPTVVEKARNTGTWNVDGAIYTLYFDNYPSCSYASTMNTWKWFGFPDSESSSTCSLEVEKLERDQVNTKEYQSDHILEAQTIVYFFRWLYGDYTVVGWPKGYERPSLDWIVGLLMGNIQGDLDLPPFIYDGRVLWQHIGLELGGYRLPTRMALVYKKINRVKGVMFGNLRTRTIPEGTAGNVQLAEVKLWQRTFAGVFQYMNDEDIWRVFTETTKSIEDVLEDFDAKYGWEDEGMLIRPEREEGQPAAGLRDLWCYFIDSTLTKIDWQAIEWAIAAKSDLSKFVVGEEQQAEKDSWIQQFDNGIFSTDELHLPGTPQSIGPDLVVPNSKYGAWDNGPAGPWW